MLLIEDVSDVVWLSLSSQVKSPDKKLEAAVAIVLIDLTNEVCTLEL